VAAFLARCNRVKARPNHHIVSVAVIVAVAGYADGRREGLGITVGDIEAGRLISWGSASSNEPPDMLARPPSTSATGERAPDAWSTLLRDLPM
jgi:hypothetical protein